LHAQAEYRNGLAYINSQNSWWRPDVLTCSALKKDGVDEVWEKADSFWGLGTNNGDFMPFPVMACSCEMLRNER
jgi:LAO/AO transport system kinase